MQEMSVLYGFYMVWKWIYMVLYGFIWFYMVYGLIMSYRSYNHGCNSGFESVYKRIESSNLGLKPVVFTMNIGVYPDVRPHLEEMLEEMEE